MQDNIKTKLEPKLSNNNSRVSPGNSKLGYLLLSEFNNTLLIKPGLDYPLRTLLKYRFVPKKLFESWISSYIESHEDIKDIINQMKYHGLIDLVEEELGVFPYYVPSIGLKSICKKEYYDEFYLKKDILNYINIESYILEMNLYHEIYSGRNYLVNSLFPKSFNPSQFFNMIYPKLSNKEFLVLNQKDINNTSNKLLDIKEPPKLVNNRYSKTQIAKAILKGQQELGAEFKNIKYLSLVKEHKVYSESNDHSIMKRLSVEYNYSYRIPNLIVPYIRKKNGSPGSLSIELLINNHKMDSIISILDSYHKNKIYGSVIFYINDNMNYKNFISALNKIKSRYRNWENEFPDIYVAEIEIPFVINEDLYGKEKDEMLHIN